MDSNPYEPPREECREAEPPAEPRWWPFVRDTIKLILAAFLVIALLYVVVAIGVLLNHD